MPGLSGCLDRSCLQGHPDSMARYSGGPVTHRALTGPKRRYHDMTDHAWQQELLLTLHCIQEIRQKCDHTELGTVRLARKAGLSWTEIAGGLGVTRQSAWERWHELDETLERD
jgi:hypothetical protein